MKTRIILVSLFGAAIANAQPGATVDPDSDAISTDDDAAIRSPGEANQALPITLQDVIMFAVRLSPDLARSRVDRITAWHQAAAAHHSQAWTVTASANINKNSTDDTVEVPLYGVVEQDAISATLGIGRNLPIGGSITIQAGLTDQHTQYALTDTTIQNSASAATASMMGSAMAPDEDAYNTQTTLGLTYKLPLLRGFGSVATADIDKAELNATEATVKAQLAAEDLVKDLVTSYWELAYSTYELDVRVKALELAKKQNDLTHEQIRAGAAQESALRQVTYELMTREDAKLQAESDVAKKSMDLRQKAGLQVERHDVVLHPAEDLTAGIADEQFDVGEIIEKARISNRKLATIAIEGKLADLDVKVADDGTKPQLDLQVQGAFMGNGESAGESIGSIFSTGYQVSAGLNFSFEVGSSAKRAKDAAEAKRGRVFIDRADTMRQIESQTALAVQQVNAARHRVELETEAMQVAELSVHDEKLNFVAGKSDNFKVLQRQTELTDARLKFGRAVTDYHIAVAQLQYLSGYLLPQYGVDVHTHQRDN
ncbi:MAG TPA: TolC family protein [Kofleriaceae bacterium]|jgi:outer membrane protein TolC